MIIISSIYNNHVNQEWQLQAVKSWHKFGKVISINPRSEIVGLKKIYEEVTFIDTEKTMEGLLGKRLVNINSLIDFAVNRNTDLLIVNSDIYIDALPEFKQDGITILSRWDYTNTFEDATMFEYGFDAFHIPKAYMKMYPPSMYGLGSCWVDYSLAYRYMVNGVSVYWPQGRYILHKAHPQHWNFDDWNYTGKYFKWEFKIDEHLRMEEVNIRFLAEIQQKAIKTP